MEKQKLMQLFSDCSEKNPKSESYENRVIQDSEFDELADRIILLFKEKSQHLLAEFWNHKSDACPLECTEMENQVVEFKEYVNNRVL